MGIYDRDYMKRTGKGDSGQSDPYSAEDKLENFARKIMGKKGLLKIGGFFLAILILVGLLMALF